MIVSDYPIFFLGSPGTCSVYQAFSSPPLEGPGYEANSQPSLCMRKEYSRWDIYTVRPYQFEYMFLGSGGSHFAEFQKKRGVVKYWQ